MSVFSEYLNKGGNALKRTIVLLITVTAVSNGFSQNIFHLELFGPGLLASLNYERMLSEKFSARIGMGGLNTEGKYDLSDDNSDLDLSFEIGKDEAIRVTAIPIGVNYLMGGNHKFEVGGGTNILKFGGGKNHVELLGQDLKKDLSGFYYGFGYRYQKTTGGLLFRFTGYWLTFGDAGGLPWFGMAFGWAF